MTGKRDKAELGRALIDQLRWALTADGITARDKIVLIALVLRTDRYNGTGKPSLTTLADDTGLSDTSVCRSIGNLQKAGLIKVVRTWKINTYEVLFPIRE